MSNLSPSLAQDMSNVCSVTDAAKPFDSSAKADIILRSSDSIDFFTIKLLLCFVSPVFDDIFSSSQSDETRHGFPVIRVTEDSRILYHSLTLIYPSIDESVLYNVDLCSIGRTLQKYQMDHVESKLRKMVLTSQLPQQNPLRIYATAAHLGWVDVAAVAASNTLKMPLHNLTYCDELRHITGADLCHYLAYRFRCEQNPKTQETIRLLPRAEKRISSEPDVQHIEHNINDAAQPFGSSARSDAVLRSSDLVDFFVLKSFLAFASPVFEAMFSSEVQTKTKRNELPVITITEDSETTRQLLLLIYPCPDEPRMEKLESYFKVREAAQKYNIEAVERMLSRLILSSESVRKEPLRVFALGVNFGWEEATKLAAMNTLERPLEEMSQVDELKNITGADVYRLMEYRFQCADAACRLIDGTDIDELYQNGRMISKRPPASTSPGKSVMTWFVEYITLIQRRLRQCPRGCVLLENRGLEDVVCEAGGREHKKGSGRSTLSETRIYKVLRCRVVLASAVDEQVSKIPINIDYRKGSKADESSPSTSSPETETFTIVSMEADEAAH
ncbi:hypothetical protein AX17_004175 [Amanita inopinata Kibby_2008]|nr:hypothetical protein AX17_004175 [Amanita inopinata Kibby_2008]